MVVDLLACGVAHPDINCRPSIRQAIHVMKFEAPITYSLPSQFPTLEDFDGVSCRSTLKVLISQFNYNWVQLFTDFNFLNRPRIF